jgi:hypothetical protein
MKSRLIIRLFLIVASGALFGRHMQLDYAKWHQLGREAFLSYQAHRFDQCIATPGAAAHYVFIMAIFALGLGALFEGFAYAGDKLIGYISNRLRS